MPYLVILTFLLAPAYVMRFNLLGFPTNLLMLWVFFVWMAFGAWLIIKKQSFAISTAVEIANDNNLLILTGLFFLSGFISLFVGGADRAKLGQFIVLFLQPISLFFIAGYIFKQNPNTKYIIQNTLYFLLAAAGLYAIFQYFTLIGLPPAWWGNSNEPKRALSFFIHPNFYALWCAPLLALLVPDVIQRAKGIGLRAKSWGILWVIGGVGLFLSLSRAGWLGLGVAMIVYLIIVADKKIRRMVFSAAVVLAIIIVAIPNFRYRLLLPFYGEKSTVSRLSLWETGWKGVKESPVLGLGLTGFSKQWPTLNTDPGLTDTHNFPHNIFLDLWVETGLLGLISLIGLIGLLIYRGLSAVSPPGSSGGVPREAGGGGSNHDIIKLSVALFLIALLFQGQIDNPYFKNDLAMVFWMVLALAA